MKEEIEKYIYKLWCWYSSICNDVLDSVEFYSGFHSFIDNRILGFIEAYKVFVDKDFDVQLGVKYAVDYEYKILNNKIKRSLARNGK